MGGSGTDVAGLLASLLARQRAQGVMLARIEGKLDAMLEALAEEGEEPDEVVSRTLDGHERRFPANGDGTL